MHLPIKAALAAIFLASVPLHVQAAAQTSPGALTPQEARQIEASPRTADDHLRLADYYQSEAQQTRTKLADAEDLMKHWSWMASRTKVPNAYTSACSLVDRYRAELEQTTKLALSHQKMAQSLQASSTNQAAGKPTQ